MNNKTFSSPTNFIIPFVFMVLVGTGSVQAEVSQKTLISNVVTEMNHAVTERNLDSLLATFSNDAVRLNLYRPHDSDEKVDKTPALDQVSDLAGIWKSVAAILFPATRFYERTVTTMDVNLDKGMAMVWATINTRSQSVKEGAEIKTNSFSEMYLLRLIDDNWKIVALTNNRKDNYSK